MNPIDRAINDDDLRFDLLVDGELTEPQRRELLARLDDQPDGWRRCALAFLEAQCWREEFDHMLQEPATEKPVPRSSSTRGHRLGILAAVAASFLVALLLGSQLQRLWPGGSTTQTPPMQVAEDDHKVEEDRRGVEPQPQPQPADTPSTPWRMVTLKPVDGSSEPVQLPAIESETFDPRWLEDQPAAIPDNVLQALRQAGHRIRQQRRWLPLRMDDGRQLVLPVEEVDVQYVGRPTL